jgi:pantoate--beta-alanine ligase
MSSIATVRSREALRAQVAGWRAAGLRIALVPTMGALHEGHLSLVRLARSRAARVVTSVFVNPTQFAPSEDFQAYPRDEARDAAMLAATGCDLLYAPSMDEIYPAGFATTVSVAELTTAMEGALRPTHFAGVATVVTKLLLQGTPDVAVFGEKDYQQLQVIRRLVVDLDIPVEVVPGPIVRDADGLALSSRNAYLSPAERAVAPALQQTLTRAAKALSAGERVDAVEAAARGVLLAAGFETVDYFEARNAENLARLGPGPICGPGRLIAAARIGRPRLLDNVAI